MATIGHTTVQKITDQLKKSLLERLPELDTAYLEMGDDAKLHVAYAFDIEPGQKTDFKIGHSLTFVAKKISDKGVIFVDDIQGRLFDGDGDEE